MKPEAKLLRRGKKIKMEITYRTVVCRLVGIGYISLVLCGKCGMVCFANVYMAKGMKRLERDGKLHHGHEHQVKYGKLSFH